MMMMEDHEMPKSVFLDTSGIPPSVRVEITTVFEILDTISFSSYLPVQVGLVLS